MDDLSLCRMASDASEFSYSPYSACKVGAALLCESGKVYTGCNIENAAFSPTVCAERTAFFKAVSEGERSFLKIAVSGKRGDIIDPSFTPCGVCRQVMAEFCKPDFKVILATGKDTYKEYTLSQLLPESFSL